MTRLDCSDILRASLLRTRSSSSHLAQHPRGGVMIRRTVAGLSGVSSIWNVVEVSVASVPVRSSAAWGSRLEGSACDMQLNIGRGKVRAGAQQRLTALLGDGIDHQIQQIERSSPPIA